MFFTCSSSDLASKMERLDAYSHQMESLLSNRSILDKWYLKLKIYWELSSLNSRLDVETIFRQRVITKISDKDLEVFSLDKITIHRYLQTVEKVALFVEHPSVKNILSQFVWIQEEGKPIADVVLHLKSMQAAFLKKEYRQVVEVAKSIALIEKGLNPKIRGFIGQILERYQYKSLLMCSFRSLGGVVGDLSQWSSLVQAIKYFNKKKEFSSSLQSFEELYHIETTLRSSLESSRFGDIVSEFIDQEKVSFELIKAYEGYYKQSLDKQQSQDVLEHLLGVSSVKSFSLDVVGYYLSPSQQENLKNISLTALDKASHSFLDSYDVYFTHLESVLNKTSFEKEYIGFLDNFWNLLFSVYKKMMFEKPDFSLSRGILSCSAIYDKISYHLTNKLLSHVTEQKGMVGVKLSYLISSYVVAYPELAKSLVEKITVGDENIRRELVKNYEMKHRFVCTQQTCYYDRLLSHFVFCESWMRSQERIRALNQELSVAQGVSESLLCEMLSAYEDLKYHIDCFSKVDNYRCPEVVWIPLMDNLKSILNDDVRVQVIDFCHRSSSCLEVLLEEKRKIFDELSRNEWDLFGKKIEDSKEGIESLLEEASVIKPEVKTSLARLRLFLDGFSQSKESLEIEGDEFLDVSKAILQIEEQIDKNYHEISSLEQKMSVAVEKQKQLLNTTSVLPGVLSKGVEAIQQARIDHNQAKLLDLERKVQLKNNELMEYRKKRDFLKRVEAFDLSSLREEFVLLQQKSVKFKKDLEQAKARQQTVFETLQLFSRKFDSLQDILKERIV